MDDNTSPKILRVACDESGHTGPDLLHEEQRYFGYGSITLSNEEAWSILDQARKKFPVQMPELKGTQLMRSPQGRRLITDILDRCRGAYAVNLYDKLLSLCSQFFEYVYEPVFKYETKFLYENNLHRFVSMILYTWVKAKESQAPEIIAQFQSYMRSLDPSCAPLLFDRELTENDQDPFDSIMRFSAANRAAIIKDNADLSRVLPASAKWVLDLSASGLWSHLIHWGALGVPLSVECDASKPLQSIVGRFEGGASDPAVVRAREMHSSAIIGFKLAHPIRFVDSRNNPANQLADLVASSAISCLSRGVPQDFVHGHTELVNHALVHSILPDKDIINPNIRRSKINQFVLFDLAQRACGLSTISWPLQDLYLIANAAIPD
jgi:hypothetical protein